MVYLSGYPTYKVLNEILQDKREFVLYLDIRNNLAGLYYEEALKSMLNESGVKNLLLNVLDYIEFIYRYSINFNKLPHIVIFFDVGTSAYHKNILKTYKSNRIISSYKLLSLTEAETAYDNIRNALGMIHSIFAKLYNVHVIRLRNLESDFIPYLMISKKIFGSKIDKHIISSNDKDMLQNLEFENAVLLSAFSSKKQVYTSKNWLKKFKITDKLNIDIRNFVYFLSIMGDKVDGIPGVRDVGIKSMVSILEIVDNSSIDYQSPRVYLDSLKQYYDDLSRRLQNKLRLIEKNFDIFERNYKLISYKELINNLSRTQKENIKRDLDVEHLSFRDTVKEMAEMKRFLGDQSIY